MLRSISNVLLAVRKVTEENPGRKTAGIDRQLVLTSKRKISLVREIATHEFWKAQPTRRVYIPKAGKPGQYRPLGIPTIKNRCAQAMLKNALEPCWEFKFESHSYGFRPGRSSHDAVQQAWIRLNRQGKDKWVLDADIKGAFDNISHDYILQALHHCPGKNLIKAWLKAGYVDGDILFPTDSGVPQGSIIGPLLANVALDGIQNLVGRSYGFVRYADDFIVTAKTKEQIEQIKPIIEAWLEKRGLEMHREKTSIVSIKDGFNFLGFNIRHHQGKCLVKPQKDKVLSFLREIGLWLKEHKETKPEFVIRHLNPRIKGWANYYRHVCSKETLSYADHRIWKMLWTWCLRRHPTKCKRWVRRKYFSHQSGRNWRFSATALVRGERTALFITDMARIRITRHVKVLGAASPDDPKMAEYWAKRRIKTRTRTDGKLLGMEA